MWHKNCENIICIMYHQNTLKSSNVLEQVVLIRVVKDGILIAKILTKNTKN